jgi:two-component system, OmpR family, phosphate regulon sensor histidine kinase PhoR
VAILEFLLGLGIGLSLLWWQRSRSDARLENLARKLRPDVTDSPFSSTSQLALAIGHQQKVQQQLEQQMETYRQLIQVAPTAYLQVDDENRFIWCNQQAQIMLGITPEIYPAQPRLLLELVRSYELDELIEQTRNTGKPCQSEWIFYPVSADPLNLRAQKSYALRGHGIPLRENQIGIFLENLQEALSIMQQHDRWASDLAHELKTPLTSIRLVAETLQSRLEPPLKGWVDRLINETVRLSNLVEDLLDLSRIERGTSSPLQLKPTDLVELIHSVWNSLEPLARKKQLTLEYLGPDRLIVPIDQPRFHRLLVNLLDNSIKYSPLNHPIRIAVSLRPSQNSQNVSYSDIPESHALVHLDVIDYGSGFPEKALPHVFERFYRADPSRARLSVQSSASQPSGISEKASPLKGTWATSPNRAEAQIQGGSGLGLAIASQIVEVHQGTIHASNHPETGGAWLQVQIPQYMTASSTEKSANYG